MLNSKFSFFFLFFSFFLLKSNVFHNFYHKKINYDKKNIFFGSNETLQYKLSYGKKNRERGLLSAGLANFHSFSYLDKNDKVMLSMAVKGYTNKIFSLFFNVYHSYNSTLEIDSMRSVEFDMHVEQGKYSNGDTVIFNRKGRTIINTRDTLDNPNFATDILSTCYYLRSIPHEKIFQMDTVFFDYYYNNSIYNSYVLNFGLDTINTKFGRVKAIKLSPLLEIGRFFKKKSGAVLWVTADDNHIPLRLEIPILKGSVYVSLKSYDGRLLNFF